MAVIFGLSYQVTHALFLDNATSIGNSFAAASEFPTATPTPTLSPVGTVVINELMWPGSASSSADEWIELRNTTNSPIDLSGWKIEGSTNLTISSGTIPANGYFLIANFSETDSNSILDVTPEVTSTAVGLNNENLQIILKDASDVIIDQADDGAGSPLAGSNTSPRKSMERNLVPGDGSIQSNWHTASTQFNLDGGSLESATPKGANSL